MNTALNQNVNVTKRARFATFAMSIVGNLCLLQQYKWKKNKLKYDCMPRLIFNGPYGSNYLTILDFFIRDEKTRRCRETTATTATGTSKNNKFKELNNNSTRASRFFVHFFAFTAQLRREKTRF